MNDFDSILTYYFNEDEIKKIKSTNIFVAGAGGIGSNTSHYLVRSGFLNFKIIDFDIVNLSNLNRQFYFLDQVGKFKVDALKDNLLKINKKLNITLLNGKIEDFDIFEITKDSDIIIEAFDDLKVKSDFINKSIKTNKPVICVSGIGGYSNSNQISYKKLGKNLFVVGDGLRDVSLYPPLSPHVNQASSIQADIALSLTLNNFSL